MTAEWTTCVHTRKRHLRRTQISVQLDQAVLKRRRSCRRAGPRPLDAELQIDVRDVALDCADADEQARCDVVVPGSPGDQSQDLGLTFGESRERGRLWLRRRSEIR